VDYAPHKKLETDTQEYLHGLGFVTHESTYHTVMAAKLRQMVQNRFTPTALYVRARADRMAFHAAKMIDFEYECKTHAHKYKHDMLVEMLPLIHHISKSKLGVRCLYCYRNPFTRHEIGFWTSQVPAARGIGIPRANTTRDLWNWFEGMAGAWFPGVPIFLHEHRNGSGDPYVIFDEMTIKNLPDWKSLIDALVAKD
jgi:hypothetical protein